MEGKGREGTPRPQQGRKNNRWCGPFSPVLVSCAHPITDLTCPTAQVPTFRLPTTKNSDDTRRHLQTQKGIGGDDDEEEEEEAPEAPAEAPPAVAPEASAEEVPE